MDDAISTTTMAERKEQLKRVNSGGMVLLAALTIADNEGAGGTPSNFGHITGMYTDTKLPAIYFVCSSYV